MWIKKKSISINFKTKELFGLSNDERIFKHNVCVILSWKENVLHVSLTDICYNFLPHDLSLWLWYCYHKLFWVLLNYRLDLLIMINCLFQEENIHVLFICLLFWNHIYSAKINLMNLCVWNKRQLHNVSVIHVNIDVMSSFLQKASNS